MDMFPSTDSAKSVVDMFPRTDIHKWHSFCPLNPCGSSMSVNKKIIIVRPDELLDSKRINIIFRTGSRFLASGFLGSLANSGD